MLKGDECLKLFSLVLVACFMEWREITQMRDKPANKAVMYADPLSTVNYPKQTLQVQC